MKRRIILSLSMFVAAVSSLVLAGFVYGGAELLKVGIAAEETVRIPKAVWAEIENDGDVSNPSGRHFKRGDSCLLEQGSDLVRGSLYWDCHMVHYKSDRDPDSCPVAFCVSWKDVEAKIAGSDAAKETGG
jgi:hypothetical protein